MFTSVFRIPIKNDFIGSYPWSRTQLVVMLVIVNVNHKNTYHRKYHFSFDESPKYTITSISEKMKEKKNETRTSDPWDDPSQARSVLRLALESTVSHLSWFHTLYGIKVRCTENAASITS